MPLEDIEEQSIQEQFEQIIATEDRLATREFLDDQNIADVAELIKWHNWKARDHTKRRDERTFQN